MVIQYYGSDHPAFTNRGAAGQPRAQLVKREEVVGVAQMPEKVVLVTAMVCENKSNTKTQTQTLNARRVGQCAACGSVWTPSNKPGAAAWPTNGAPHGSWFVQKWHTVADRLAVLAPSSLPFLTLRAGQADSKEGGRAQQTGQHCCRASGQRGGQAVERVLPTAPPFLVDASDCALRRRRAGAPERQTARARWVP